MNKKIIFLLLTIFMGISLFLHLVAIDKVPPCLNADEAAYGYNAYSLLKTGRDEYGAFLPLRLKSFEDYKLPLYSYFSIPFIYFFGLTDFSTRALNILIGVAFVPLIYLFIKELFNKEKIALTGAFLVSVSTWIHIMSRQAQEGVLCSFFILLSVYFLIRYSKSLKIRNFFLTNLFIFLSTFSYHTGRIFLFFIVGYEIFLLLKHRKTNTAKTWLIKIAIILFVIIVPLLIDYKYSINRVANLVFYKNIGFQLKLDEYLNEHNLRIFHNKLTEGVKDITYRYLEQISPEFLVIWGDKTWRFGYKYLGIITLVEYLFIFIGIYYLFKDKAKQRFFILYFLFVSPLGNALTWQEYSLIRTYFMIFPATAIIAYGIYSLFVNVRNKPSRLIIFCFILAAFFFNLASNWDIYLIHYPKRAEIIHAWQCGYKEIASYVKANYDDYDRFVITDKRGQPYIFILFYIQYDPAKYQKQAKISAPDEYGFGQIGTFDKYSFKFQFNPQAKKTVYVGYPEEFKGSPLKQTNLKKIKIRNEEIFWIYEVN